MTPSAPYISTSDTSRAAARSIEPSLQKLERLVILAITAAGGATSDEIEQATGLSHQCASARCSILKQRGVIRDSGLRRRTRSGRNAAVYEVSP